MGSLRCRKPPPRHSDETGRDEVYVRPFPNMTDWKRQVSTAGGLEPVWAHSGKELFYRDGANDFVAVEVMAESTFSVGQHRVLFSMAGFATSPRRAGYDVRPDDARWPGSPRGARGESASIWRRQDQCDNFGLSEFGAGREEGSRTLREPCHELRRRL